MSADAIPKDAKDLLGRAVDAGTELIALLAEEAAAYVTSDSRARPLEGAARVRVWGRVERIAERWRDADCTGALLREFVDEVGTVEPLALLGAIEDSLVLSLSSDPALRELALSAGEVTERVEELRKAGAFEGRVRPPRRKWRGGAAGDVARFEELSDAVIATHGDNFQLYARLQPDGRELGPDEAAAVRERVWETAATARALDAERELVEALADRRALRADLELLRDTLQGFVLALAEDPARRAKAIPISQLGGRWKPLYERWKAEVPGD